MSYRNFNEVNNMNENIPDLLIVVLWLSENFPFDSTFVCPTDIEAVLGIVGAGIMSVAIVNIFFVVVVVDFVVCIYGYIFR